MGTSLDASNGGINVTYVSDAYVSHGLWSKMIAEESKELAK